jgi:hypothetical protein
VSHSNKHKSSQPYIMKDSMTELRVHKSRIEQIGNDQPHGTNLICQSQSQKVKTLVLQWLNTKGQYSLSRSTNIDTVLYMYSNVNTTAGRVLECLCSCRWISSSLLPLTSVDTLIPLLQCDICFCSVYITTEHAKFTQL